MIIHYFENKDDILQLMLVFRTVQTDKPLTTRPMYCSTYLFKKSQVSTVCHRRECHFLTINVKISAEGIRDFPGWIQTANKVMSPS